MKYETFLNEVKEQMQHELGEGYSLTLRRVPKNNGLILDGLCITKGSENVAPAIYLNPCYIQYRDGRAIGDIVKELMALYQANRTPPDMDYSRLSHYDEMKSQVACKLIHAASNQALLKDIPHVPWMDLAIVFYLCIHEDETGLMTAMINRQHMDIWDISLEELRRTALDNTPRLFPPVISSMDCMIEDMNEAALAGDGDSSLCGDGLPGGGMSGDGMSGDGMSGFGLPDPDVSSPFYVLSNISGINGAACILYRDVVKNFADGMEKDIIILPSSIHEVLLLPDEEGISCDEMSRLVTHINQTEVPKEDRLSNQVYHYSRIHQTIALASSSLAPI